MFTSLSFSLKRVVGKGILLLVGSIFVCTLVSGQKMTPAQDVGDLSAIVWKPATDFNQSLAMERSRMDLALTTPGLPASDRSLYLSYHRLLDYIQSDVQAGTTAAEAITNNYVKVLQEAPSDQDLKDLPDGMLQTYLPGLIEALTEVPVPLPGQ